MEESTTRRPVVHEIHGLGGCLDEFLREFPAFKVRLLKDWEMIKCPFGNEMMGKSGNMCIALHYKLAPKWEAYEQERGHELEYSSEVELTKQDVESIFDPMVDKILKLIAAQLKQVPDIKVIFVVWGFASSPYLMQRIRDHIAHEVAHIVSPPNPDSAVAHGAVSLALHPDSSPPISKTTILRNWIDHRASTLYRN